MIPLVRTDGMRGRPGSLVVAAVLGIAGLGLALRLAQYLHNRPLWLDEAALALQIMYKTPTELLGPLGWHQNAPLGFLLALKVVAETFGTSEYALRLLPLLGGLFAVPAFCVLLRQTARESEGVRVDVVLMGLALFAVGKHLIYYSSELRHYSWDVLAVCLLLSLAHWAHHGESIKPYRLAVLTVAGLAFAWFLLAPLFVLAAITATYGAAYVFRRQYAPAAVTAGAGLLWFGSFLLHVGILSAHIESRGMQHEIETMNAMSWAPLPTSLNAVQWYRDAFDFMFYHPVGLTYRGLGGFAFLIGLVALWRRDKRLCFLIAQPILLALAASFLHRYPFRDRYIHFLAPLLIVAIAEGVGLLTDPRRQGLRVAGVLLAVMLLAQPAYHALKVFQSARGGYEIRPLLVHIKQNWEETDGIYVPVTAVPSFLYYWPRLGGKTVALPDELLYNQTTASFPGWDGEALCLEPDFASGLDPSLDPALAAWREKHRPAFLSRRNTVWILYLHDSGPPIDTPAGEIDAIGRLLEVRHEPGAALYRYATP